MQFRIGQVTPDPQEHQTAMGAVAPDLLIPDFDPAGVQSEITLAENGKVQAARVSVNITHTWSGDLQLNLIAPNGQNILLRDNNGQHTIDVQDTYDSVDHPALAGLAGGQVHGTWRLHVQDLERRDTGRLNAWSIEIDVTTQPKKILEIIGFMV